MHCGDAESVFQAEGYSFTITSLTITSLTDGEDWRKRQSLHLVGLAFDCRIWDVPEVRLEALCDRLRASLGDEFDVVLETDHIHVEFDPDGS